MLKYAPNLKKENQERENYLSVLQQEGKVDLKRTFGSLSDKELTDMQDAFQRAEGFWRPDRQNPKRDPMPSDLSRHLPKDKSLKTNRVIISGDVSHHSSAVKPIDMGSFTNLEQFATYDVDHPVPAASPVNPPAQPVDDPFELPDADDVDEYFTP